jgi:hypothetical protein
LNHKKAWDRVVEAAKKAADWVVKKAPDRVRGHGACVCSVILSIILLAMIGYVLYLFAANTRLAALYLGSGGALASLVSMFTPTVGQIALRAAHYATLFFSLRFLFSVQDGQQIDQIAQALNAGTIPDALKQKFGASKVPCSDRASVEVVTAGEKWRITDPDRGEGRVFSIRLEAGTLSIYYGSVTATTTKILDLLKQVNHDPTTRAVISFYTQVTTVFTSLLVIIIISVLNLYLNIDKVATLFVVRLSLSALSLNTIIYGLILLAALATAVSAAGDFITPYIIPTSHKGWLAALLNAFPPFRSWLTVLRFLLIILGGVFAYVTVSGS